MADSPGFGCWSPMINIPTDMITESRKRVREEEEEEVSGYDIACEGVENPGLELEAGSHSQQEDNGVRAKNWTVKETMKLLQLRMEAVQRQTSRNSSRLSNEAWVGIADQLKQQGFIARSGTHVSEKWGSLRAVYWAIEDRCFETGKSPCEVLQGKKTVGKPVPSGYTATWHELIFKGKPGKKASQGGASKKCKVAVPGEDPPEPKDIGASEVLPSRVIATPPLFKNISQEFQNVCRSIEFLVSPPKDCREDEGRLECWEECKDGEDSAENASNHENRKTKVLASLQSFISAMQLTPMDTESVHIVGVDKDVSSEWNKRVFTLLDNQTSTAELVVAERSKCLLGDSTDKVPGGLPPLESGDTRKSTSEIVTMDGGNIVQTTTELKRWQWLLARSHGLKVQEYLRQALEDQNFVTDHLIGHTPEAAPSNADTDHSIMLNEVSTVMLTVGKDELQGSMLIGHTPEAAPSNADTDHSIMLNKVSTVMLTVGNDELQGSMDWCERALGQMTPLIEGFNVETEVVTRVQTMVIQAQHHQENILRIIVASDPKACSHILKTTLISKVQNALGHFKVALQRLGEMIPLSAYSEAWRKRGGHLNVSDEVSVGRFIGGCVVGAAHHGRECEFMQSRWRSSCIT